MKAPRVVRFTPTVLNELQAKALLKSAAKHRLGPVFSVALAIGLRLGETLGLRWEDVDLENRTLTVRRALQRIEGKLEFVEPTSEKSRRTLQLPAIIIDALKKHRTRQKKERLKAGANWQGQTSCLLQPLARRWMSATSGGRSRRCWTRQSDWLSVGCQLGNRAEIPAKIGLFFRKMVSREGIEPSTRRLRVCCSAN